MPTSLSRLINAGRFVLMESKQAIFVSFSGLQPSVWPHLWGGEVGPSTVFRWRFDPDCADRTPRRRKRVSHPSCLLRGECDTGSQRLVMFKFWRHQVWRWCIRTSQSFWGTLGYQLQDMRLLMETS